MAGASPGPPGGTAERRNGGTAVYRGPPRSVVEAEAPQLLGIALPILRDLDAQIEEHARAEQRLDLLAGAGADVPEAGALGSDNDGLLAGPLDVQVRVDVDQVVSALAWSHVVHDHGDRVRQLVSYALQRGLADQLGGEDLLWLVGEFALGIQGHAL